MTYTAEDLREAFETGFRQGLQEGRTLEEAFDTPPKRDYNNSMTHITIPRETVQQAIDALKQPAPTFGTTLEAIYALRTALDNPPIPDAAIAELVAERDRADRRVFEMRVMLDEIGAERDLLKMREVSWESSLMAASAQNEQLRSLLNTYNLGGWTDSLALMKERDEWRTIATTAHRYIEENKALQAMKGQTHD